MTIKPKLSIYAQVIMRLGMLCICTATSQAAPPPSKRVVTVGGVLTETVFALGAANQLVAVDTSSTFPVAATQKPQVGYQRNLSSEGLLSVSPDLIIASAEAGPPSALAQLKASGVDLRIVPMQFTPEAALSKIRTVSAALGLITQGHQLEEQFAADWRQVQIGLKSYRTRPRVLFLLSPPGSSQLLVAGRNTAADAMINLAGGANAVFEFNGYKPLTAEAAIAAAPDVLLIAEIDKHAETAKQVWEIPGLNATPAVQKQHIVVMEPLYLLGFGPRLPQAVAELAARIHEQKS